MAEVTLLARIQLLVQREEDIHRLARALEELGIKIEQAQMRTTRWGRGLFAFHMSLLGLTFSFWSFTRQFTGFIEQASRGMRELEESVAKATAMMILHYEDAMERMSALQEIAREMAETSPFPQERILQALAYADAVGLGVAQFKELTPIIETATIVLGDYEKASRGVIDFIMYGNKAILRRIGLMITKEELEQRAIELYGVEYSKLDSLAQAYVRYNLLVEQASRISSSYQGQIRNLAQAIEDLKQRQSALNNLWLAIPPALRGGIQSIGQFVDTAGRIGTLAMTFVMVVSSIKILANSIKYVSDMMAQAGSGAGLLSTVLSGLSGFATAGAIAIGVLAGALQTLFIWAQFDSRVSNMLANSIWNLQVAIYQLSGGLMTASPYVSFFGMKMQEAQQRARELADAIEELSSISWKLQGAQAGLNSIMMQLEELYKKRTTLETKLSNLLVKKSRLERAIADLEQRRAEIQQILNNWTEHVKEVERDLARARLRVARASLRIQQVELRMAQARARLGDIAMRLQRQSFEIARARWRVAEATFRLEEAERRLNEEREKLIDLQRQIEIAENRLQIARLRYGESSWEVWEAERDLDILRERLEDQQWRVREAEMEVESARWGVQDATLRVQEAVHRYNQIAREQADVFMRLRQLELERQEAILQLQEAQIDLNKATERYNNLSKERKQYEEDLKNIEAELDEKMRTLQTTEQNITQTKEELNKVLDQITNLEGKRKDYMDDINNLMKEQEDVINKKYVPALENLKKVHEDIVDLQKKAIKNIEKTVEKVGWAIDQIWQMVIPTYGAIRKLMDLWNDFLGLAKESAKGYRAPEVPLPPEEHYGTTPPSETNINVNVNVSSDGSDIASLIADEIERKLKQRLYSF